MATIDLVIVVVYLTGLFGWAIYIGLGETADDFLVFSRRAPFVLVLFSIVSTWVGVGTTVVTAASAYETGLSLGATACTGGILGACGAALYAPRLKSFGDKYGAYTIGDFFLLRYSKTSALISGITILIVYVLMTAAQLVGLASLLTVWTGTSFEIVIVLAAVSTIIYTAFAGIKSDFYTDGVHFITMIIVIFIALLPIVNHDIGNINNLLALPDKYFNLFEYGGISFFIAGIIFGGSSVFVTMELWQRVYASSSGQNARWALAIAIIVIVVFYAASVFLGLSAKVLLPGIQNKDQTLFILMSTYLPKGLLGLGVAGFMAIFLSTLNSTIMVASATFTKDIWCNFINTNGNNEKKLLIVGRASTLISGALGMATALIIPDLVALSVNSMFMLLVLLPSIVGGFVWKRPTAKASIISVSSGVIVTVLYMGIDPNIAFVPGFIFSLISYILVTFISSHSSSEQIEIVSDWRKK